MVNFVYSNDFWVVSESNLIINDGVDPSLFTKTKLYKALSLFISKQAAIPTPPTLLMLDYSRSALESFADKYGDPLMIRMDYSELPAKKTLGGIPIYGAVARGKISKFLYERNCVPIFHPHYNRFSDEYSAGVLISRNNFEANIEIVGKGFDASDLRLGNSVPHEFITVDLVREKITQRNIINASMYEKSKVDRIRTARKYMAYTTFANTHGKLLPELNNIQNESSRQDEAGLSIPNEYLPLTTSSIRELETLVLEIVAHVLDLLPLSREYIASFSRIPKKGWILWDIYGAWYMR